MTLQDVIALGAKVGPLVPRLEKAVATLERIAADPEVKEAIATFEEAAAVLSSAAPPPTS